jgi:hypothetical protein
MDDEEIVWNVLKQMLQRLGCAADFESPFYLSIRSVSVKPVSSRSFIRVEVNADSTAVALQWAEDDFLTLSATYFGYSNQMLMFH